MEKVYYTDTALSKCISLIKYTLFVFVFIDIIFSNCSQFFTSYILLSVFGFEFIVTIHLSSFLLQYIAVKYPDSGVEVRIIQVSGHFWWVIMDLKMLPTMVGRQRKFCIFDALVWLFQHFRYLIFKPLNLFIIINTETSKTKFFVFYVIMVWHYNRLSRINIWSFYNCGSNLLVMKDDWSLIRPLLTTHLYSTTYLYSTCSIIKIYYCRTNSHF